MKNFYKITALFVFIATNCFGMYRRYALLALVKSRAPVSSAAYKESSHDDQKKIACAGNQSPVKSFIQKICEYLCCRTARVYSPVSTDDPESIAVQPRRRTQGSGFPGVEKW